LVEVVLAGVVRVVERVVELPVGLGAELEVVPLEATVEVAVYEGPVERETVLVLIGLEAELDEEPVADPVAEEEPPVVLLVPRPVTWNGKLNWKVVGAESREILKP
jgi:hypothetical protein